MYKEKFMKAAFNEAQNAASNNEVPVGSVIILDDEIIAVGSNTCISKNSPIRHAEIEAIESACSILNNYRLPNTSIYVTLEPCHMCCMAIINARIDNLFFGAREPKTGAVISVDNFFENDFLNHKVSFSGGHMEEESKSLLRKFFVNKR